MSHTILVVISDPVERQEISVSLTNEGFEVVAAEDGFSGLEKVEQSHPAVFLMDISLQGLNGLEISQLLREKPQFSETPIFLCSDKDNPLISEAERLGVANQVFSKPMDQGLLLRSIREQLGIQEPRKESLLGLSEAPEDDSVRIEELLGWEAPSDRATETSVIPSNLAASDPGSGLQQVSSEGRDNPETAEKSSFATSAPPSLPSVSQEMVEKMTREIIERVVWEVVPRLAEAEIKKEIERLKKGE
ncbi:MAG: response regulator [Nitrospirae bacterium]|nr:response regulator [Nitrospirota bacterium]